MDDIISRKRTLADLREIQETLACGGDPILAALMNTPIKKVKEQPTATPWVKTSDRLPQEFISVLVCIPSETPMPMVKEAYLANGWWTTKTCIFPPKDVTHWAPMPEPPKEETT